MHRTAIDDPRDQGAAAARARVEALLERLARVDLRVVVVAPPDAIRLAAEDRARDAAIAAGRGALLDEAVAAAREETLRSFARAGFSGTWAVTDMSVSIARASDRVAAAAAFAEAAMAAVVEDVADPETLDVLRSTAYELGGLTGLPSPGSLEAVASPAALAVRGPLQVGLVVLFVTVAAVGLAAGGTGGLLFLALAIAGVAGLAKRRRPAP